MSDGDDETADEEGTVEEEAADGSPEVTPESLDARLDAAEEELDAAETEADLDDVEATLDGIERDLEDADLPEPDGDDEEPEDPREALESRLSDLRDALEEQRGPYAEDVVSDVESAESTVADTRWTERGLPAVADAVEAFLDRAGDALDRTFEADGGEPEALAAALGRVATAVEDAGLDPDRDADTIAELVAATGDLSTGIEEAEEWDDLQVRDQLRAEGFYDVLGHYKDFPPAVSALKEHESRGDVDMILLALDSFDSDFMEERCLDALARLGDSAAYDAMFQRAGRRDKDGIRILGKMGPDAGDAVETLAEYVAEDDPGLQKVTLKALGEIGSREATQAIADALAADDDAVRSRAARALGLVGDPRAVEPLADALDDDGDERLRANAAWALRQIGTEPALSAVAEYTDDRSFLVQTEAERAATALGAAPA